MSSQKRSKSSVRTGSTSSFDAVRLLTDARVQRHATSDAILQFLEALDCPRSLTVWLLYFYGEDIQLVNLAVNPEHYSSSTEFRDAYTATEFLSKSDFLQLGVDRKEVAVSKFLLCEEACKHVNRRFRNLEFDPQFNGPNVWLLNAVTRKISSILGDFSAEEFVEGAGWGPGSSVSIRGTDVSGYNKFTAERGITRKLYSFIRPWFSQAYPLWSDHLSASRESDGLCDRRFDLIDENEVITVPKNAKTDRVIAIEPGINLWFQKSIGSMIRRRLRRNGINLDSQRRNQELARIGSKFSNLATVDFSAASDSISYELIRSILPPRWFSLLDSCRTGAGRLNDNVIRWEKFSSMGNGFTFELESLVFFAAAHAVCEYVGLSTDDISVFGDDVIIPSRCYEAFAEFSKFLGFTVNKKKSFSSTYFRESCGAHWFDGVDCKPVFLKEAVHHVEALYRLANRIRDLAHRRNARLGCDASFEPCWVSLRDRIPKAIRFGISAGYGDGGLVSNFDEALPHLGRNGSKDQCARPFRAKHGFEGYYQRCFTVVSRRRSGDGVGLLLDRLWRSADRDRGNSYDLRGRTKTQVSSVLVPRWYDLGPWL